MAIMIRCRMPPENWCGIGLDPLRGSRDLDPLHQAYGLVQRIGLVHPAVLAEHLGDLPADRERPGSAQTARPGRPSRSPARGSRRRSSSVSLRMSVPAVADLATGDEAGRGVQDAHDRLRGHRLA